MMGHARFRKKMVVVDGRKVFYWQKGDEKKEVIVFLHGFPGNHMGLVNLANGLGEKYELIIPDLPACGLSEALNEKHILKSYSQWLNLFLEKLLIDKAIIVGHSFGARVALFFGAFYPERVERLALLMPIVQKDGLLSGVASFRYKIAKFLPKYLRKVYLSNKLYEYALSIIVFKSKSQNKRKQIMTKDMEELKHLNVKAHIELFDEFYQASLVPLGKKIKAESLIVAGDKDKIATLKSVKELVGNINNVSFEIMKNAGHIVPVERPQATAKVIKTWLENSLDLNT